MTISIVRHGAENQSRAKLALNTVYLVRGEAHEFYCSEVLRGYRERLSRKLNEGRRSDCEELAVQLALVEGWLSSR